MKVLYIVELLFLIHVKLNIVCLELTKTELNLNVLAKTILLS